MFVPLLNLTHTLLNLTANLTVTIKYPSSAIESSASHLFLRGQAVGLSWDAGVRVFPSGEDTWSITLPGQPLGSEVQFKALIDDKTWAVGTNAAVSVNTTTTPANYYPFFTSNQGRYEYVRGVKSSTLGNVRDLVVYVPPGYDENPYMIVNELLVMQDGENVFNDSTSFEGRSWRAGPTLDAEVVAGRMRPALVVAVDNTMERIPEYTYIKDPQYGGGNADEYLDFLEHVVIPLVLKRYRLLPSSRVSLLGSSLGGLLACYAAWSRPVTFPQAACMSASFWWDSSDFLSHQLATRPSESPRTLYLDSGTADGDTDIEKDTVQVRDRLEQLGYTLGSDLFYYLDQGGCHSEPYWGARLQLPLRVLYPPP